MPTKLLFPQLQAMRIDSVALDGDKVALAAAVAGVRAPCPLCRRDSARVHSRYQRVVADLPVSGRRGVIVAEVRRSRRLAPSCARRIFAERLPALGAPGARW